MQQSLGEVLFTDRIGLLGYKYKCAVTPIIFFKNKQNFYIVSAIRLAIESKGNGEGNGATSQRAISGYKPQRLWQNILLEKRETEKVEIFEIADKV